MRTYGGASHFHIHIRPVLICASRSMGNCPEESALIRANRMLRMISNCNQALIRGTDPITLAKTVCKIITDEPDYRLAWVGMAEAGPKKRIIPIAYSGFEKGYLENAGITYADTPRGRGPTGTAIRTGKTSICGNVLDDPKYAPWREQARKRGYASSIAIPIMIGGKPWGALNIYAKRPDFFDAPTMRLLDELAGDLAFGIRSMQLRNELREAEARYSNIFRNAKNCIAVYMPTEDCTDFIIRDFNAAAEKAEKVRRSDIIGRKVTDVFPGVREFGIFEVFKRVSRTGRAEHFPAKVYKDNRIAGWRDNFIYRLDSGEVVAVYSDLTKEKQAEESLVLSESKYAAMFQTSPYAIILTKASDGRIMEANRGFEKLSGFSHDELIGKTTLDLNLWFDPDDREAVIRELSKKKSIYGKELQFRLKSGVIIHGLYFASIVPIQGEPCILSSIQDITKMREAEEALLESEKHYAAIFDNAPDVIAHLDNTGRVIRVNHVVKEKWGYSPEVFIGKSVFAQRGIFPPHSLAELARNFRKRIAGHHVPLYTVEARAADGRQMFIEVRGSLIRQDGQVIGDVIILREVTERKKAAEALVESEEKFRKIVESSNELVMLTSPDGTISYLSPACFRVLGWRPQDLIGRRASVAHPEDRPVAKGALSQAIRGKSGSDVQYRIITRDGSTKWVSHSWSPMMLHGKVRMIASVVADITERKKAEMEIRDSRRRLSDLIDFLPDATFAIDSENRISLWNKAMVAMSGLSAKKMLGKHVTEIGRHFYGRERGVGAELLLKPKPEIEGEYDSLMRQDDLLVAKGYVPNLRGIGKEGYAWILAKPLYDSEGNKIGVIESVRDITEQNQYEEALRAEKEKVEELSKVKERFMADMTHELKTPLSVILLNLDMVRKMDPQTQLRELGQSCDLMWRNCMRLSISVEQIMQLTKLESVDIRPERFKMGSIIRTVLEDYAPLARTKGISLDYSGRETEVDGDPHVLSMAVSNLVSNALKFTQKGGVRVMWQEEGPNVVIYVSDSGIGIRVEDKPKVFSKFFKEDHNAPGSGIGLALSSTLIQKMGGRIEFESRRGRGSTFRIIIPKVANR